MDRSGRLREEFRDRTKRFAGDVIRLYAKLPRHRDEVQVCGHQLLRLGTSVAAHVREASRARSDAEFISKLGGAAQEADESMLWLELFQDECGICASLVEPLKKEAGELLAIPTSIIRKTKDGPS